MHVTRLHVEGFKRFDSFDVEFNPLVNIVVGDNETGKSSLLDALGIALTGQYEGRTLAYSLDPFLFNSLKVAEYFAAQRRGENRAPPRILIEAYLDFGANSSEGAKLRGTNNTRNEDCSGLVMNVAPDPDFVMALRAYARDESNPEVLPIEYYRVKWQSFAASGVTLRDIPFRAVKIDTGAPKTYRGPDRHIAEIVNGALTEEQKRDLALQYRKIRHSFSQQENVKAINAELQSGRGGAPKNLTVQLDLSTRSSWDSAIVAHLDDRPFEYAGKGEQCRVQLRLAVSGARHADVLLIEEPENHLSHSNLNKLMGEIAELREQQQVMVTTHSAFVLNKLGLDRLLLIAKSGRTTKLSELSTSTRDFFMKLPGYDTLRLILAERTILVEGPSDELVVQRAFRDRYGKLPSEEAVEVISVGLAFKRFLEIARLLQLDVRVVTDNDGDPTAVAAKFVDYLNGRVPSVRVCYDTDENCKTLEPQLLKANSLVVLNEILGTTYTSGDDLLAYMSKNKTDVGMKLLESSKAWDVPEYIRNAIE